MKLLRKKYIVKAITWRLISIVVSLGLSYVYMESWSAATSYTIIYSLISTMLFYGHELLYKWMKEKGVFY